MSSRSPQIYLPVVNASVFRSPDEKSVSEAILQEYRSHDGLPHFECRLQEWKEGRRKLDRLFPLRPRRDSDSGLWDQEEPFTPAHDVALALAEARVGVRYELVNGPDRQGMCNNLLVASSHSTPTGPDGGVVHTVLITHTALPAPLRNSTLASGSPSVSAVSTHRGRHNKLAPPTSTAAMEPRALAILPSSAPSQSPSTVPSRRFPRESLSKSSLPVHVIEDSDDDSTQRTPLSMPCTFIGQSVSISPSPLIPASSMPIVSPVPTPSPSLSPASSVFVSPPSSPHLPAHAMPAVWDALPVAPMPTRLPAASISTVAQHPLPLSGEQSTHAITAPPRGVMSASLDLPPPYATTELTSVPLPPVTLNQNARARTPARRIKVPPWFSPTLIPITSGSGAVRRVVNTLCTPAIREYLRDLQAEPLVFEVVHKCMFSYPQHGGRNWATRLSECGFTGAEITHIVHMFPRRPRGATGVAV